MDVSTKSLKPRAPRRLSWRLVDVALDETPR